MNQLSKPVRTTLSAQIVEQMEQCIKDNAWPVGSKIPGEVELMETFGVSRNTVREATLSLVHAGLLQATPGDGTYVMSRDRLEAAMQKRLKNAKFRDILELRWTLESDIVLLASKFGTEDDMRMLKEAKTLRDKAEGTEDFVKYDMAFHMQLAEQCHNTLLRDLYKSNIEYIETVIQEYEIQSEQQRQNLEHDALFEAVVERKPDVAVSCVKKILEMEKNLFEEKGLMK